MTKIDVCAGGMGRVCHTAHPLPFATGAVATSSTYAVLF